MTKAEYIASERRRLDGIENELKLEHAELRVSTRGGLVLMGTCQIFDKKETLEIIRWLNETFVAEFKP